MHRHLRGLSVASCIVACASVACAADNSLRQEYEKYYYGRGVPVNHGRAKQYLEEAAQSGEEWAILLIAQEQEKSAPQKALDAYLQLARNDNCIAQARLADAYSSGTLVKKNVTQAYFWLLLARVQRPNSNSDGRGFGYPMSCIEAASAVSMTLLAVAIETHKVLPAKLMQVAEDAATNWTKGTVEKLLPAPATIATASTAAPKAQPEVATTTTPQAQKPNYSWDGWHNVPAPSRIRYKVLHDKVVALSNLAKGCDAGVSSSASQSSPLSGKIAKLNFDNQGLIVQNFILEQDDGERSLINIDPISIDDPGMNRADLGWIIQGLQTLLRPNWHIQGSAFWCGAAGRVVFLDGIQSVSSTKPITPNTTAFVPEPDVNVIVAPQSQPAQTASNNVEGIPLSVEGGTFVIPVLINGQITLNFTIDSGAADVSIPADVVSTLIRTGTIQKSDFIGQKTYRLADGSTVPSAIFVIRSLKVGNHVLENVTGSIASAEADLLLGQSF